MTFRPIVFALCVAGVFPASAEETYRFRVSIATVGEGRQALTPDEPVTIDPADERQREPVMLFRKLTAKYGWRTLFMSCGKLTITGCEIVINARSGSSRALDAVLPPLDQQKSDLGFTTRADGTMSVRCLREACALRYAKAGRKESEIVLTYGESRQLPLDIEIDVTLRKP